MNAELRVGTWPTADALRHPGSRQGRGAGALGLFGVLLAARHHRPAETRANARRLFWIARTAELAFMGIAEGVASALASRHRPSTRCPRPPWRNTTPAEILTGQELPPELTWPALLHHRGTSTCSGRSSACFAIFFYAAGVLRLRRRGDAWPFYRTVLWMSGIALLFYITNGGVNVYEKYLFCDAHAAHMLLTMASRCCSCPARRSRWRCAPIRKRRRRQPRGGREWILLLVHSRFANFISNPLVAAVLFAGSLWASTTRRCSAGPPPTTSGTSG